MREVGRGKRSTTAEVKLGKREKEQKLQATIERSLNSDISLTYRRDFIRSGVRPG